MFVRWASQEIEQDDAGRLPGLGDTVVRRFNAPQALNMRFHEVRTKSALNRIPAGARLPFDWTVNPYRGCSHACAYCFARPTHEYLDLNAGEDFEREIIVKVNVPEVLRAELARPSWKGERVALGTNTDPYQWVEGRYKLMRGIWEALRDAANPCSILTKSPLLLRDLDLLKEIAAVTEVSACLSVPTLDEKAWRATEPHTPHPRARLEAVAELNRQGIPTGILIAPLMPGVNDAPEQVARIVDLATEAGATYISGNTLFLRGSVRGIFFDWLREHRPDLLGRYEELYAHGAYLRLADRRTIERAAGAPWAGWSYEQRTRHRGVPRRRPDRPRGGVATAAPAVQKRPPVQASLF
jgi:DNA repair photolyase